MKGSFFDNCYLVNRSGKHEMMDFVGVTDNDWCAFLFTAATFT